MLAILTADCVPIVLHDPVAGVLACVHAGWRGTVARVSAAALAAMQSLGSRPADVIAGVGPAIAQARYQVGPEVHGAVTPAFGPAAGAAHLPRPRPGPLAARPVGGEPSGALPAGVPAAQIHVTGIPTGTRWHRRARYGYFFSDRMARPCGRLALVASLEITGPSNRAPRLDDLLQGVSGRRPPVSA